MQMVWPVPKFRDDFEYLTDMYGRMHYELRPDWRRKVRPYVERVADIVLMKDCVDVPAQHEQVIHTPEAPKMPLLEEYESPSAEWYARHRNEQGEPKLGELKRILDGYRKAIVVCQYTEQVERYAADIGKDRAVYVLQGSTKDADAVIQAARAADDCVFIIQASMGAGFDAAEFSVVIFASLSFRYVDMVQMKGRVKRINNLHENLFIYLIGGPLDQSVYDTIQAGKDFDVHHQL
jgi:superfamily II DNA or RNA helicase